MSDKPPRTRAPTKTAPYEIVIESVVTRAPSLPDRSLGSAVVAERLRRIAALVRHLAMQRDLHGLGCVAEETTAELLAADRARCLFHNADEGALWRESRAAAPAPDFPSTAGIAGVAARSGRPYAAPIAAADPAYLRVLDDPEGTGQERLLAQPVRTASGETHAVIVVARGVDKPPFSQDDFETIRLWAEHAAPLFHMHYLEAVADEVGALAVPGDNPLFRAEAIEAQRFQAEVEGDPLRSAPRWTRLAHFFVLGCVAACLAFTTLARIGRYASGPALLVSSGHRDVTALQGGVLERVLVQPGDVVEAGQVVAELGADAERSDLERARRDLDRELAARLRDPADTALEQRVASLRVELEAARRRLRQKLVVAPTGGRIGDVRSAEGQAVQPGQVVVTLVTHDSTPKVQAFVPGRNRPALHPGQTLVLELEGFTHASQFLAVTSVGEDVLGPAEMQRMVGPQLADAIAVAGPVVMVEAELPAAEIEVDGEAWTLHDGMTGRADVELDEERVIVALFPRLAEILPP